MKLADIISKLSALETKITSLLPGGTAKAPGSETPKAATQSGAEPTLAQVLEQITAAETLLTETISAKDLEISNLKAKAITDAATIQDLTGKVSAKQKLLDDPKLAANVKALQIAQSQGLPPGTVKEETGGGGNLGGAKTKDDHWAHYATIQNGEAKRAYYLANKEAM
jgi:hypothetical protein